MPKKLSAEEIQDVLDKHSGWEYKENYFQRSYLFKNFSEALAFIVRVGIVSEKLDHHPTLSNTYNEVSLKISTHSEGNQVTDKDAEWLNMVSLLES